ncbi:Cytochrome oxidase c assembly family protein [Acanthocheilonema viteae]|uniref:Uncharacterized protein n=1 Tax=Acanthocheilonema viteae TaxID=6277 RepID=A0A498SDH2_ACAVI|nr:unnamed protein product [Acanthocheilonema viteae]
MLLSRIKLAAKRAVIRPFYKRIFTDTVLDKLYSTTVVALIGGALCIASVALVNVVMYYKVVKPIREADREQLEKDLIKADEEGFSFKL